MAHLCNLRIFSVRGHPPKQEAVPYLVTRRAAHFHLVRRIDLHGNRGHLLCTLKENNSVDTLGGGGPLPCSQLVSIRRGRAIFDAVSVLFTIRFHRG